MFKDSVSYCFLFRFVSYIATLSVLYNSKSLSLYSFEIKIKRTGEITGGNQMSLNLVLSSCWARWRRSKLVWGCGMANQVGLRGCKSYRIIAIHSLWILACAWRRLQDLLSSWSGILILKSFEYENKTAGKASGVSANCTRLSILSMVAKSVKTQVQQWAMYGSVYVLWCWLHHGDMDDDCIELWQQLEYNKHK